MSNLQVPTSADRYRDLLQTIWDDELRGAIKQGYDSLTYRETEMLEKWIQYPEMNRDQIRQLIVTQEGKPITAYTMKTHIEHITSKLATSGIYAALERYRLLRIIFGPPK